MESIINKVFKELSLIHLNSYYIIDINIINIIIVIVIIIIVIIITVIIIIIIIIIIGFNNYINSRF